jgi:dihydrolipoamide dehydrogenase
MEKYDVCIIGAGPAGYAAAMRGLDLGLKILLVEKHRIGGAGLYDGALSSKTLWELSKDVQMARKRVNKYSICKDFMVDFDKIKIELHDAIQQRKFQLEDHLDQLKKEGFGNLLFTQYGKAEFLNKNEILITNGLETETIWAEHTIIATGSRPRKLPNIPIDERIICTSDSIHAWEELPRSMVILGAGVIGCEYATIYSNFGRTKVYLIDKASRILNHEDTDVVDMVETHFENNGIHIHRNASLDRMEIIDGRVEYALTYEDGRKEIFNVDKALVSVGRIANIEGLGLEKAGVELNSRNAIQDYDTQTSVPNIWAIGDVTADIALVNVGELEGRHAINRIAKLPHKPLDYANVSNIMFLKPEVAGVGLNEKQCREKGISYQVVALDYSRIPRAIAMRNPSGFFKIIVTNDQEMKVLGMRAVGPHASSAIQAVGLLISENLGISALAELIHPHPSLIEGIQECCRMLLGTSIFKPQALGAGVHYTGYVHEENPVTKN